MTGVSRPPAPAMLSGERCDTCCYRGDTSFPDIRVAESRWTTCISTHSRGLASRRRLLTGLAALPVLGGLLGILDADDAEEGGGRRKRRKKRHKH